MTLKNINGSIFLCLVLCTLPAFSAAQEEVSYQPSTALAWGACARQGRRRTMEDAHVAILNFAGNPNQALFGIYDGHGGAGVAQAVACGNDTIKSLHSTFAECTEGSTVERLKKAFEVTEKSILSGKDESGTTAVTALLDSTAKMLTVAWVGDSRAVVVQGNSILATGDHKPDSPLEEQRIKKVGGFIAYPNSRGPNNKGAAYIGRALAVSRALGNKSKKKGWYPIKGLTAKPEIAEIQLTGENAFAIFACDGIWDVLSNQDAAEIVAGVLNNSLETDVEETLTIPAIGSQTHEGNNDTAVSAARLLCASAYALNSQDNLSAIVVQITKTDEPFLTEFSSEEPLKSIIGSVPSDDEYSDDELAGELKKLGW